MECVGAVSVEKLRRADTVRAQLLALSRGGTEDRPTIGVRLSINSPESLAADPEIMGAAATPEPAKDSKRKSRAKPSTPAP